MLNILGVETLGLTLGGIVFAIVALVALAGVPALLSLVPVDDSLRTLLALGRWPVLAMLVLFATAVLYRFAPTHASRKGLSRIGIHGDRCRIPHLHLADVALKKPRRASRPSLIEGYAIVSSDCMIADADGSLLPRASRSRSLRVLA